MLNRSLFAAAAVLILVSFGQAAYAAPTAVGAFPEIQGITVVGHADIIAKPDIVYLSIGVVTQDKDMTNAAAMNSTTTRAVIASLHDSGIADKDIQTDNYSVQPQYDYHSSPPVLTGYQVTNSLRATIRDISKAGTVSDKAVAAGANQVGGLSFDIADKKPVQAQALVQAIMDARMKAKVAAMAAGVGLGRLLNLSAGAAAPIQPIFFGAAGGASMRQQAASTPFEVNQMHVSADVTLLYAIDYSSH